MTMKVTKDKYITLSYSFSTPEGYLLGSSENQGPLVFCAGSGDILPGLDSRIMDKEVGEQLSFVVPAAEAYGVRDESLLMVADKKDLQLEQEPKVGYRVEAQIAGHWRNAVIVDIKEDQVTLDANHPLAGVDLNFSCSVLSVEDEPPASAGCGCSGNCSEGCGGGCGSESSESGGCNCH